MHRIHQQSGIALITAILIAALVTAAAVATATNQQFGIQRGHNVVTGDRLQLVIRDLEAKAGLTLAADRGLGQTDDRGEIWATANYATTRDNLTATGVVEDLQGRFNLTNLSNYFGANVGDGTAAAGGRPPVSPDPSSAGEDRTPNDSPLDNPADSKQSAEATANEQLTEQAYQDFLLNYQASCQGELWWCAQEARYAARSQFGRTGQNAVPDGDPQQAADDFDAPELLTDPQNVDPQQAQARGPVSGPQAATPNKKKLAERHLVGLFRALDLDLEPIQAILDWIDEDSEARYPNGAEDEYYTGLSPGYRSANKPFSSPRELLLVRGITPEVYVKLKPFITILPQPTKVNVNTASAEVLMSLSPLIDRGTAEMLIQARTVQPFQSVRTFTSHPLMFGRTVSQQGLSVDSNFFELSARASGGRLDIQSVSTLYRNGDTLSVARRSRSFIE